MGEGLLPTNEMPMVTFDYVRLRALLYPEESAYLDRACGLYSEGRGGGGSCWSRVFGCCSEERDHYVDHKYRPADMTASRSWTVRAPIRTSVEETNDASHRFGSTFNGNSRDSVGGSFEDPAGGVAEGVATAPLTRVVQQLLRDVMYQPMARPWGYPERVINLVEVHFMHIGQCLEHLDRLGSMPLPLPYLQHCKVLLLVLAVTFPFTIDNEKGIWANVVTPSLILCALIGLEAIADQMENPLSDDVSDLNLHEMVHSLELSLSHTFTLSEISFKSTRRSLKRPMQTPRSSHHDDAPGYVRHDRPERPFSRYFAWVEIPRFQLEDMLFHSGHIDKVQEYLWSWEHLCSLVCQRRRPPPEDNSSPGYQQLGQSIWQEVDGEVAHKDVMSRTLASDRTLVSHFLCLKDNEEDCERQMKRLAYVCWNSQHSTFLEEEDGGGSIAAAIRRGPFGEFFRRAVHEPFLQRQSRKKSQNL